MHSFFSSFVPLFYLYLHFVCVWQVTTKSTSFYWTIWFFKVENTFSVIILLIWLLEVLVASCRIFPRGSWTVYLWLKGLVAAMLRRSCSVACGILVPQPGVPSVLSAARQTLDHWNTGKVPSALQCWNHSFSTFKFPFQFLWCVWSYKSTCRELLLLFCCSAFVIVLI